MKMKVFIHVPFSYSIVCLFQNVTNFILAKALGNMLTSDLLAWPFGPYFGLGKDEVRHILKLKDPCSVRQLGALSKRDHF